MEINKIYNENCLEGLKTLPDNCIDCCVTSPPYYALRDYGVSGQIGLENSPEEYVSQLVAVFTEVYRVLKPAGTLWLNIGDSYAGSGRGWGGKNDLYSRNIQPLASFATKFSKPKKLLNYKNKDLIGIPWLLAFALRAAGWYLRQDIIWHKPNPMPESITDRCTKSHEYLFLLTKSLRYYFNNQAIMEKADYDGRITLTKKGSKKYSSGGTGLQRQSINCKEHKRWANQIDGAPARNKRSVWTVCTYPEKEAHFACFPQKLIVDCIKAGCSEGGIVLDPFMGSGTTAIVARKLGRNYIGFELNPQYVKIAERKLRRELGIFE
jgi:DNA modification methylase